MSYAEGTTVSVFRTRSEIEALVGKYGAKEFSSGWMAGKAAVQFMANARRVRLVVQMPTREWGIKRAKKRPKYAWGQPPENVIEEAIKAEEMRLWRCLLISIKAKLEAVGSGIASFDEEFLAHIVTADDDTIYEKLQRLDGGRLLAAVPE